MIIDECRKEDWYQVKVNHFLEHGGSGMLLLFHKSPYAILKSIFPDHDWLPWKFSQVSAGYWYYIENQQKYIRYSLNHLNFFGVRKRD